MNRVFYISILPISQTILDLLVCWN